MTWRGQATASVSSLVLALFFCVRAAVAAPADLRWSETHTLSIGTTTLDYSVDVSGDWLVAGNPSADIVRFYQWTGTQWTFRRSVTGATRYSFGYSVAIDGLTAIIGAPGENNGDTFSGLAYVYVYDGTTWAYQATLVPADGGNDDFIGWSVAVSGDTAVVGAPQHTLANTGAAYVYTRAGTNWSLQQKLVAFDSANSDEYGTSVSVSGDTILVGSPYADTTAANAGAAYVYARSAGSWMNEAKLASTTQNAYFGWSVDVDGAAAIVGAPRPLGSSIGAAHVFVHEGLEWLEQQVLSAGAGADRFGAAVAIHEDGLAVVGAPYADASPVFNVGAAYLFTRTDATWTRRQTLYSSSSRSDDHLGLSIGIDGDLSPVVIGSLNYASSHVFTAQSANGFPCAINTDCVSGNCVDGVCCDSACGGGAMADCLACSVAAGAAADGVCGAVASGLDVICRPAAGTCDVEERCDGVSTACPANVLMEAGTPCRDADPNAVCDAPEMCDGRPSCPSEDAVLPAGTPCRLAAGDCDAAETCDGANAVCPSDALLPQGTECRAAAYPCDAAESCDGTGVDCPEDVAAPDGASCDDGVACTTGECVAGACELGSAIDCDDGNGCTADSCDSVSGCVHIPLPDDTACEGGSCRAGVCSGGGAAGAGGQNSIAGQAGTLAGGGGPPTEAGGDRVGQLGGGAGQAGRVAVGGAAGAEPAAGGGGAPSSTLEGEGASDITGGTRAAGANASGGFDVAGDGTPRGLDPKSSDDSGCGCTAAGGRSFPAWPVVFGLLAVLAVARVC